MAVIAQTAFNKATSGPTTITRTVLSASDTLVYTPGAMLELFNTTASPVTVTIDGSGSTTISPSGFGGTVDVSAGKAIVVPASSTVYVNLDSIAAFLQGTVAVTGGVGVTAHIVY
jgi:hypothetical protein